MKVVLYRLHINYSPITKRRYSDMGCMQDLIELYGASI